MDKPQGADALPLSLAAHYRSAWDATAAIDTEVLSWSGGMADLLRLAGKGAEGRSWAILKAICAVPAEGMAGALVQLEAASLLADVLAAGDGDLDEEQEAFRCAVWSIATVLRGATGIEGVVVGEPLPRHNPFDTELAAIVASCQAEVRNKGGAPVRKRRSATKVAEAGA
jgi:hypothetical protein